MPELVAPTVQLRDSWLAARDDWGPDAHQDGAGLSPADDVDTPQGFSDWVERLHIFGALSEEDELYFNEQFAKVIGVG